VPDPRLSNDPGPDVIAVVEESLTNYRESEWLRKQLANLDIPRSRLAFIIHSVPDHMIEVLVTELQLSGKYIYITDSCDRYYERFGHSWLRFVGAMQSDYATNTSSPGDVKGVISLQR